MAFNLFSAITSGIGTYNALSNTQTGQNLISKGKHAIAPITQPIQKAFAPAYETAKSAVAPITGAVESIAKPVVQNAVYQKKIQDYYAPFKSEIEKIGITYDDLAELPEEEKQQVVSQLKQIGVQIPGLVEAEQAVQQQQAIQGEDLGIIGNIGEAAAGGFRVGEQIPRYAGNLLNLTQKYVTTPLIAGGAEALGADKFAQKWRSAGEKFGEGAQTLGEEITKAGEGDITEKQRTARRVGANIVATAPIPIKGLGFIKGSGILPTIGRGALAGAEATPISIGLEEGRLPTMGEQTVGTVGGAILGPLVEKVAIPGIQKGYEAIQKQINPVKFTQQIDDETVKLVRQAIRPSTTGVDTATKFDVQDAKLLQGVKEVVKQGKAPKTAKELMQAIQDTKQNIWSKVEQENKAVVKTTTGDDIATKLRSYVADPENKTTFLSRPELKANLLKYADEVQANKDFSNITQQELQDVLTDINSRIPASSFLKQLDANPTQTAQNTVIAKIYRDIIDDNLENAVGTAGKEARQAYGSVRQLEKDFAKRYGVYLRQNPKGIADMFGMEGFADIAAGLLTSSPSQVIKGVAIQGAKKLIKNANNPDTIIRDIFKLQSKVKPNIIKNANTPLNSNIPPVVNPNAVKKVKGQTVKKPIIKPNTIKNESKVNKPTTGDTIPEGYKKNVFGEIVKKPSNKKGGFIKIPSLEINPEKAIKKYTNNSDKINKMLREGKTDSTITAVDEFIGKQPSYKGDVYRGLTVDEGKYNSILENIRKNGIKDKAYTSTTENYGDATTFARNGNGKKGIIFEIQSTNGKKIDKKYNAYNEEEILFPRDTKFEYVGEYKDAGRGLIIKLKEVQPKQIVTPKKNIVKSPDSGLIKKPVESKSIVKPKKITK